MNIGISSSCFYPDLTEEAFKKVCKTGTKTSEIFFNSSDELVSPLINEFKNISEFYGVEIRTIHPFTSFAEPYFLFSSYKRRTQESLEFYKSYFEAAAILGAEAVVIHGANPMQINQEERCFEVFGQLCDIGREFDVYPAQENVSLRAGCDLSFLKRLKSFLKKDFKTVLDIKQCRRSGVDEFEFINLFGENIIQVHISDYDKTRDCIPPGEGNYDFDSLFKALNEKGYNKSAVIELYNWSFKNEEQIKKSFDFTENIGNKY